MFTQSLISILANLRLPLCDFHLLGLGSPKSDISDSDHNKRHSSEAATCLYEGQSKVTSYEINTVLLLVSLKRFHLIDRDLYAARDGVGRWDQIKNSIGAIM